MKFLIIDDNKDMRQTLSRIICRNGDEVVESDDGKDALALYLEHLPDWVLMDISMKEVTGITATEQITQADPSAKVVIVTDYTDRYFQKMAIKAGARAFVSKENLQVIHQVIGQTLKEDRL